MRNDLRLADITYRANRIDRREVALRLRLPASEATAADGWARLCSVHGPVDPRSIEIEVREVAPA